SLQISNAANVHAQRISLSEKNASLEEVFKKITLQSGSNFLYTSQMLSTSKPVTLELHNVSLKEALAACLEGQPLSYSLEENTIVLKRKKADPLNKKVELATELSVKRQDPVTGVVADSTGVTLPGAS